MSTIQVYELVTRSYVWVVWVLRHRPLFLIRNGVAVFGVSHSMCLKLLMYVIDCFMRKVLWLLSFLLVYDHTWDLSFCHIEFIRLLSYSYIRRFHVCPTFTFLRVLTHCLVLNFVKANGDRWISQNFVVWATTTLSDWVRTCHWFLGWWR